MKFCTVINCMDGRVQVPVIEYLQQRFDVENVDCITEPGPNRILAERTDAFLLESIEERLRISVQAHNSVGIAVAGHADCAGNPVGEKEQQIHTAKAVEAVRNLYPDLPVLGLWVNEQWGVRELTDL